uniref:BRCT domain-containing protein n=1 Tax=Periophthalmus magnuspinnatus TaxID=409849 RepID=A0A3B4BI00_9GOBI
MSRSYTVGFVLTILRPICRVLNNISCFRSCAGSNAGNGCVVCHSPAWVKDIQINRQLSSVIELFCGLEKLVNPAQEGVEACLRADERVSETPHEAGEGPQRSRINRCNLLPPLFDGCFFFLLGSFSSPAKEELTRLLRDGGGQILSRQPKPDSDVTQTVSAAAYHASPGSDQALCTQYILYDPHGPHKPVIRRGKVWSAPSSWIIQCITAFRLLPVPEPQT